MVAEQFRFARAIFIGGGLLLAGIPPAAAQSLTGWGPFKFGQTIEQAAKAAGPTAQSFTQVVQMDVEIEGETYTAFAAALGPSGRIVTSITLSPKAASAAKSWEECQALFDPMRALIANKYGKAASDPVTKTDELRTELHQELKLRDGATITALVAFKPSSTFGGPCTANIDMKPAKSPDGPRKMEF